MENLEPSDGPPPHVAVLRGELSPLQSTVHSCHGWRRKALVTPRGYMHTSYGFRAWIRVSSKRDKFDQTITKRFSKQTTLSQIRQWRTSTRDVLKTRLEAHRATHGTTGTFRSDAQRYLQAVKALACYKDRCRDIGLWVEEFGSRQRESIAAHEIRAVRDRWLTQGPRMRWAKVNGRGQRISEDRPVSASTVNHRLRALSNLYTVLDGRRAPNPVRDDVPEVDEPVDVPRALDYDTVRQILDAMSDQGLPTKGKTRRAYSLAKVRARVLAWTGITPKELGKIAQDDIRFDDKFLVVPARKKGRGVPGRLIPLGPSAIEALTEFDRLKAYGRFEVRVVRRAWQRACQTVLGQRVRLYDLRHSFITGIVKATGDLHTAGLIAGHGDSRTTQRYATAAMLPLLRAGVAAFSTSVDDKEKPQ